MNIKDVVQEIVGYLSDLFYSVQKIVPYLKELLLLVVAVACLGLGYTGYQYWSRVQSCKAQRELNLCLSLFKDAAKADKDTMWDRVAQSCDHAYSTYKKTDIAPLFLSYQADALWALGKKTDAIAIMKKAVAALPVKSALVYMSKIKYALMLMDSEQAEEQQDGLHLLIDVARDEKNTHRDYALFYLGRYYWVNNQLDEAKKAWQDLIDMESPELQSRSAWAREAQKYLMTLHA